WGVTVADFDGDGRLDLYVADPNLARFKVTTLLLDSKDSDSDFLRRVILSARGAAPTALEEKYFAEDKDPKKREKLLDLLLKDPMVAKKLGDDWKLKMLEPPTPRTTEFLSTYRVAVTTHLVKVQPNRFEKLVGELLT